MSEYNKTDRLATISGGPFKIIKEAAKAGLKGVRNLVVVFVSFAFCNLVFLVVGIFKVLSLPSSLHMFLLLIAVLLLGIFFTVVSVYWAYKNIITEIIAVVYMGIGSTIMQVCSALVEKVSVSLSSAGPIGEGVVKSVDYAGAIKERLDRSPGFIKMGILLALQRTPMGKLLSKVTPMLQSGRKEEAKQRLFTDISHFVLELLLGNKYWSRLLLAVNILVQVGLLYMIK